MTMKYHEHLSISPGSRMDIRNSSGQKKHNLQMNSDDLHRKNKIFSIAMLSNERVTSSSHPTWFRKGVDIVLQCIP